MLLQRMALSLEFTEEDCVFAGSGLLVLLKSLRTGGKQHGGGGGTVSCFVLFLTTSYPARAVVYSLWSRATPSFDSWETSSSRTYPESLTRGPAAAESTQSNFFESVALL